MVVHFPDVDQYHQCERLSQETGCWMYITSQHPDAHNSFEHFTSRRLLNEPDHSLLDELHNNAARMYNVLYRSRHSNLQQMTAQARDAEEVATKAREVAARAEAELDATKKQLQESQAIIDRLSALTEKS